MAFLVLLFVFTVTAGIAVLLGAGVVWALSVFGVLTFSWLKAAAVAALFIAVRALLGKV